VPVCNPIGRKLLISKITFFKKGNIFFEFLRFKVKVKNLKKKKEKKNIFEKKNSFTNLYFEVKTSVVLIFYELSPICPSQRAKI